MIQLGQAIQSVLPVAVRAPRPVSFGTAAGFGHNGDMNTTELILIRHGETVWNAEGRLQGNQDSPLTRLGHHQAMAVARRLQTVALDAIYSSDLGRTLATASYLGDSGGLEVVPEPGLRERHNGIFEGMTIAEAREGYPEEYARLAHRDADYAPPGGGESLRCVSDRACRVIGEIAARHPGERIAIVSHGAVLSAFLRRALGLPLDAHSRFSLRNACLNWVTYSGVPDGWHILTLGEVSHLEGLPTLEGIVG